MRREDVTTEMLFCMGCSELLWADEAETDEDNGHLTCPYCESQELEEV